MMKDIFRQIENSDICVSRDGSIIFNKKTGKIYKQYVSNKKCRYKMVGIHLRNRSAEYVHYLVMLAWCPESIKENTQIHHIDGDTLNNDIDNLICLDKKVHNELHKLLRQEIIINRLIIKMLSEYKEKMYAA